MITEFISRQDRKNKINLIEQISNAIFENDNEAKFAETFIPAGGKVPKPKPNNFTNFLINVPKCLWAINYEGMIIGFVLICDMPHANSIGFSINSSYANKGIMKKAWKEICNHADIRYPLNAYTSMNNEPAINLLKSIGFEVNQEIDYLGEKSFHYIKNTICK